MRQNQKGMTLIEVIVSLLILSTASLMAFSSFSVIIRTMNEGSNIKNSSNKIVSLMDGDAPAADKEGVIDEIKTATAYLSLEGGTQINVHGTAYKGTIQYGSDASDVVELSKFTTKTNKLTPIEQLAFDFKKELQNIIYVPGFIDNIKKPEEYYISNIKPLLGNQDMSYNNDVLRDYLFKYYYPTNSKDAWPSFDASKFEFDTNNQDFINAYKSNLKGIYYIQPFFPQPYIDGVKIVLFARTDNTSVPGWSDVNFYFNDTDNHWYYKPSGWYGKGGFGWGRFSLTTINNTTLSGAESTWSTIKERMINVTDPVQDPLKEGWVRLKEK